MSDSSSHDEYGWMYQDDERLDPEARCQLAKARKLRERKRARENWTLAVSIYINFS